MLNRDQDQLIKTVRTSHPKEVCSCWGRFLDNKKKGASSTLEKILILKVKLAVSMQKSFGGHGPNC